MSIEDRLRESLDGAARAAAPSERAWVAIERGIARRERRNAAIRVGSGALVAAAFVAGLTWGALALRSHRQVATSEKRTLVVAGVKVLPTNRGGPGAAKVYGSLTNQGSEPTGATITCALEDASGREVATTTSVVEFVEPHKTVTFGAGAPYQTPPVAAACTARPRTPVSPAPIQPPAPRFQLSGAAFFDADRGIAGGAYGTPECESGCRGWIETTSDGGKTWTRVKETEGRFVSVTVSGSNDAWAVENEACAYICPALWRSTDGGRSWTNLGQVNVINPTFVSPNVGFAIGYQRFETNAPLLATSNGGRTWHQVSRPCGKNTYPEWGEYPAFVSSTHGWILCNGQPSAGSQSRTLLETTDGGSTWRPIVGTIGSRSHVGGLGTSGYPEVLFFRPDGTAWIGLGHATISVMRSRDGGRQWDSGTTIDANGGEVRSMWFLDDAVGYAVISVAGSPADRLIATTDGGLHWRTVHIWESAS